MEAKNDLIIIPKLCQGGTAQATFPQFPGMFSSQYSPNSNTQYEYSSINRLTIWNLF